MAKEDYREVIRRLEKIENSLKDLTPKKTGAQMKAILWGFLMKISQFILYMGILSAIIWLAAKFLMLQT